MSGSKHFEKIAWTITALMLVVTLLFMNGARFGMGVMVHAMGYENRLFDKTKVHTIDIVMDDWDEFIANAQKEEYYPASVVIDGEAFKNIGIRGKGNTSLTTVSSMGSDRYSFKIEFDQYDSAISYHGLDKLSLNNLIQDSTMMKDYLTYTMMNEFGVHAPLCSFVYITVNGEDWGLYLAVEGVEESFLERNYGSDYGELYKPDSMSFGGGRGNGMDFDMDKFLNDNAEPTGDDSETETETGDTVWQKRKNFASNQQTQGNFDSFQMGGGEMPQMPAGGTGEMPQIPSGVPGEMPQMPTGETGEIPQLPAGGTGEMLQMPSGVPGEMPQMPAEENGRNGFAGIGGPGNGSSDVKLQYVDDNIESYTNIWNNAKTDITESDQIRLIESLEKLSSGEKIEAVVDIEQVIRYFVVHNYVCNDDSYTGMMIHNYYLYEEDGKLSMIPWDYNLAFGTFQGSNATNTVNTPIDTPVSSGSADDRPMLSWIFENEEYTEMYHQYFSEFLETVDMEEIVNDAYELIKTYVEKDPTAFYTYEEFETGVKTLGEFCSMRTESIMQQLENNETENNMNYVDASNLTLSDMGTMKNGKGGFGGGNMPQMPEGFGGEVPEGFDVSRIPDK